MINVSGCTTRYVSFEITGVTTMLQVLHIALPFITLALILTLHSIVTIRLDNERLHGKLLKEERRKDERDAFDMGWADGINNTRNTPKQVWDTELVATYMDGVDAGRAARTQEANIASDIHEDGVDDMKQPPKQHKTLMISWKCIQRARLVQTSYITHRKRTIIQIQVEPGCSTQHRASNVAAPY